MRESQQRELVRLALKSCGLVDEPHKGAAHSVASGFFLDLDRSSDLRELAGVPLLLIVLLWLHRREASLPEDRFAAYARMTGYLVADYPARRRQAASQAERGSRLTPAQIERGLSWISYRLMLSGHEEISRESAKEAIAQHFADDGEGLGVNAADAERMAEDLIGAAFRDMGILVEYSPGSIGLVHRSLQEFLAAICISRKPLREQLELVGREGAQAAWSEVLLAVLSLTARTSEKDELVDAIRRAAGDEVTREAQRALIAEIAVAPFGCSTAMGKRLLRESFEAVETGPSLDVREAVLLRTLNGTRNPAIRELVAGRMRGWLPCVASGRDSALRAVADWSDRGEAAWVVWRGFFDDDNYVKRAAGSVFASWYGGQDAGAARIQAQLALGTDPLTRAALLEALAFGWRDSPSATRAIEFEETSPSAEIRLVAIAHRINLGKQTAADLEEVMRIAVSDIQYAWRHVLGLVLGEGWPGSSRLRDACLASLEQRPGLDRDVALETLLRGYRGDEQVVEYCKNQITTEQFPFNSLYLDSWRLLAKTFRDEPVLVEALDAWIPAQEHRDAEVAAASLLGRTPTAKKRLLHDVEESWIPFWAAGALLEGWGMEDEEVARTLRAVACGEPRQAGKIAGYFDRIFTDPTERVERLFAVLTSANERPGIAVRALAELGDRELAARGVDLVWGRLGEAQPGTLFRTELLEAVVEQGPCDPRVRPLALALLEGDQADADWSCLRAVAEGFSDDEVLRKEVLLRLAPLPARLRRACARQLGMGSGQSASARDCLFHWPSESDGDAAAEAATAWVRRARESSVDEQALGDRAAAFLQAPLRLNARQAALVACLELGRVELFAAAREPTNDKPAEVALTNYSAPYLVVAETVVKNWTALRAACGESLVGRFRADTSAGDAWDVLALFADQSSEATTELLEHMRAAKDLTSNMLGFLSRVRPKSEELFLACCRALRHLPDRSFAVTGAELIGLNFGGDAEALERLVSDPKIPLEGRILALAEGWPGSSQARAALEEARRRGLQAPIGLSVRAHMASDSATKAFGSLRSLLEFVEARGARRQDLALRPTLRRLSRDTELVAMLDSEIKDTAAARELASFPRLLGAAGVMSADLRERCQHLARRAMGGDLAHLVGFDLVSGALRSVGMALYDALMGSRGQAGVPPG